MLDFIFAMHLNWYDHSCPQLPLEPPPPTLELKKRDINVSTDRKWVHGHCPTHVGLPTLSRHISLFTQTCEELLLQLVLTLPRVWLLLLIVLVALISFSMWFGLLQCFSKLSWTQGRKQHDNNSSHPALTLARIANSSPPLSPPTALMRLEERWTPNYSFLPPLGDAELPRRHIWSMLVVAWINLATAPVLPSCDAYNV